MYARVNMSYSPAHMSLNQHYLGTWFVSDAYLRKRRNAYLRQAEICGRRKPLTENIVDIKYVQSVGTAYQYLYGVASVSRIDKIIGLFFKRAL